MNIYFPKDALLEIFSLFGFCEHECIRNLKEKIASCTFRSLPSSLFLKEIGIRKIDNVPVIVEWPSFCKICNKENNIF